MNLEWEKKKNVQELERTGLHKLYSNIFKKDSKIKTKDADGGWQFSNNLYESFSGSDACVILTEWADYSNIDWIMAAKKMRRPSWVFDARSVISSKEITQHKLNFWQIGSGN